MSGKKDNNSQASSAKKDTDIPQVTHSIKMREDTIPVIVVNGVYYPS